MKITSVVDIVKGDLKNTPAVSFITQTHTNISKVNDGDLFISSNKKDIYEAISKGAFTIVYDCNLDILALNNEIAYIKVDNINNACVRLLRYSLSNLNINVIKVDDVSFELFNIFKVPNNNFLYLQSDILQNYEQLQNIDNLQTIISTNTKFLDDIYPNNKNFNIVHCDISNLIVHSLFETSFSFKNRYFSKLRLPLIYVDNFINVIEFLNISDIDTSKLKMFKYMQAIFINKSNQIIDYGKSNRFLIANSCENINFIEVEFMKKVYSYGKIKIIEQNITCEDEIYKIIKEQNFNALYIKSKTKNQIIELLNNNQKDPLKLF